MLSELIILIINVIDIFIIILTLLIHNFCSSDKIEEEISINHSSINKCICIQQKIFFGEENRACNSLISQDESTFPNISVAVISLWINQYKLVFKWLFIRYRMDLMAILRLGPNRTERTKKKTTTCEWLCHKQISHMSNGLQWIWITKDVESPIKPVRPLDGDDAIIFKNEIKRFVIVFVSFFFICYFISMRT